MPLIMQVKRVSALWSAGNSAYDNDSIPSYPFLTNLKILFPSEHMIIKAKSLGFLQWGKNRDLFAPGVNVLSTIPGNKYKSFNGTSMATPHVSGIRHYFGFKPYLDSNRSKKCLLNSVDPEQGLANKCVTGGRSLRHFPNKLRRKPYFSHSK